MKTVKEILIEQGAHFDEFPRGDNFVYKIKSHYTECYNKVPVRSYWRYTGQVIIADKSGKIIGFETCETTEIDE